MLYFLIDTIFIVVGAQVFQQSVGIPMGTNCAPLLMGLFLYLKEAKATLEKNTCCGVSIRYNYRQRLRSIH
jgi:hypothetical protein